MFRVFQDRSRRLVPEIPFIGDPVLRTVAESHFIPLLVNVETGGRDIVAFRFLECDAHHRNPVIPVAGQVLECVVEREVEFQRFFPAEIFPAHVCLYLFSGQGSRPHPYIVNPIIDFVILKPIRTYHIHVVVIRKQASCQFLLQHLLTINIHLQVEQPVRMVFVRECHMMPKSVVYPLFLIHLHFTLVGSDIQSRETITVATACPDSQVERTLCMISLAS